MKDGVSSEQLPGIRRSVNFGYLILPVKGDLDSLIDKSLRTRRFSIMVEKGGGIIHDCFAIESAINEFIFPTELGSIGSAVVFLQEPIAGKAIIIGVINKQSDRKLYKNNQYIIERVSKEAYAAIIVDGRGQINIDIVGSEDSSPKLNINLVNSKSNAELNIKVKGRVTMDVDGDINLKTNNTDFNVKSRYINFDSKRLKIGTGSEPMVLGGELKKQIEKTNEVLEIIKDSLLNWVVVASDGGAALKTYVTTKLTGKEIGNFDEITSDKSFLD